MINSFFFYFGSLTYWEIKDTMGSDIFLNRRFYVANVVYKFLFSLLMDNSAETRFTDRNRHMNLKYTSRSILPAFEL